MNRLFAILLAASFALTAVAAVAENAVGESQARRDVAWQQRDAGTGASGPVAAARTSVTGLGEVRRENSAALWSGNFRAGRKHPPAGR